MLTDDCKTNSAKVILHAIRHCRKVFWYAYALQSHLEITKTSIRMALGRKEYLKNQLFELRWEKEVLFIREIKDNE